MLGPVRCSRHSVSELLAEIRFLLRSPDARPRSIYCLNANVFNLAWSSPGLARCLNGFRIVTADGMAVVWAGRMLRQPMRERCNMTESFREFLEDRSFPPSTAILIGGDEVMAARAADAINAAGGHLRVTRALSGYRPIADYPALIRELPSPDFILIGMGTPRSEELGACLAAEFPRPILWHIGGGTVQFYAGCLREAPAWMRSAGLQWLHRLLLEPGRMWRRYLLGNPLFAWRILRIALSRRPAAS